VNPGEHVFALQQADAVRRARKPHLEAGVAREEHLVARLDGRHVGPDGRDDAASHLRRFVRGHDQAARQLRFVELLDDDVVVQRLEPHVRERVTFQHGSTILGVMRVTNADKVFFPERGLTKGDLVSYYAGVAELVLPHLRRRPFHMKRFPNGVAADFFHQKRVPANHPDYVDEVFVQFPSGHSTVFAIVDNADALTWVANLGCIELHTWSSRVPEIERPDYVLIDLDPTSAGQWPFVREIALVVREALDELGLRSYPKTSGATGLHILAPIKPELPFPEVRRFAKALAVEVERRIDDQAVATTTWRVADRVGVFVDYGQNARDRTIAAAYSVRPVPDARVSAPLRWDEVATVEPESFTLETMAARIDAVGDPMRGMWRNVPSLRSRFSRLGLEPPPDP
jgi:bifunctional non-homologous end joining protein LigD